jgi:6-phosphogluconolactonase
MTFHTLCPGARKSPGVVMSVLITVSTLTGCHGGGGSSPVMVAFDDKLGGTLRGLVGSGLVLQDPIQLNGPGANGTNVLFGSASLNTNYDLAIETQPTNPSQTCVVANGTGMASGTIYIPANVTNITVTCTTNLPRFVFVANRGSNNVSAYTVDAATGTLAATAGSPFAAGNSPVAIAVDPTGTYAYVANQTDATISAFTIDRTSGALASVKSSPFATGPAPNSVAIDPSSSFVYVTNGDAGTVSAYTIDAGGTLSSVPGSPFATGTSPSSVAVNPHEYPAVALTTYVYVANQADDTVSQFTINFSNGVMTGALTADGAPIAAGMGPRALTIDPSGQYVYVANAAANTLSGYNFYNNNQGTPTVLSGSPYKTGGSPTSVAVDALDNFVFVANEGSNNISAYALAASGDLTALAGSPFAAGDKPSAVAVDPTGSFVYVTNAGSGNVSVFAVTAGTGALSEVSGSPYAAGSQPSAIAISD